MADENASIAEMIFRCVDDETTYNWFHKGRGVESTTAANAQAWREIQDAYDDVLALVKQGLAKSQASWEGVAADGAHGAVSPMQAWVQQATDSAAKASATVEAQSSFFSDTKARLEPPVQVPDKPWWNDFWPGETNYDQALAAKQANSERNLDLVWSYGDSTQTNTAGYPAFDEPVVVTTDVAPAPERPGIVEWPTAPRPKPATAGGPPEPGGPGAEPRDPAVAGPGPVDSRPEPQTGGSTVSSGHVGSTVANTLLPQGQSQPGGRLPVGANPLPGVVGVPGRGAPDGSGRIPATRIGEPGQDGRPGGRGSAGPDGRPGAGGRVGGALPEGAAAGRGGAAGVRGAAGNAGGLVPGGGNARSDEDKEHTNKFGPVDHHEDFWEDLPMVAPEVIGMDDDEQ